ncbi:hypothetical protein LCGC14_0386190 [marine sediment metagenome]|uniref:Protein NO VEIN C-terminal domain-containing protein n=1 Tax=marine sediment metagenome TaxID=412755 RepID=A0A0F9T0V2_9ZZZZ
MNATETKALKWLCLAYGIKEKDITFRSHSSPDFLLSSGAGIEVKKLQSKSCRTITFGLKQWQILHKQKDIFILVFSIYDEPDITIPFDRINDESSIWCGYRSKVYDYPRWQYKDTANPRFVTCRCGHRWPSKLKKPRCPKCHTRNPKGN